LAERRQGSDALPPPLLVESCELPPQPEREHRRDDDDRQQPQHEPAHPSARPSPCPGSVAGSWVARSWNTSSTRLASSRIARWPRTISIPSAAESSGRRSAMKRATSEARRSGSILNSITTTTS